MPSLRHCAVVTVNKSLIRHLEHLFGGSGYIFSAVARMENLPENADAVLVGPDCDAVPRQRHLKLSEPLSPARFAARVGTWLAAARNYKIGRWLFEPESRRLRGPESEEIKLTEKEADILLFLASHPGEAFSREQLLQRIWQYHPDVTSRTLETHIYKLRQKIEKNPDRPKLLVTKDSRYSLLA